MIFLGQVDQVEVGGESSGHGTRLIRPQRGNFLLQLPGGLMVSATPGLGLGPDALFGIEDGWRFQLRENLTEQGTEQVNGLRKVHRRILNRFNCSSISDIGGKGLGN